MKKQLLFASAILIIGIVNAQVSKKANRIPANIANKSVLKNVTIYGNEPEIQSSNLSSALIKSNKTVINNAKTASVTSATIGSTYYDLQSNSSVGDRIVVNADGTIATAWTMAPTNSTPSYADRGTGYNYFNGSTWGAAPTVRLEAARVGWGNVVNTRTGKELILSHNATAGFLSLASRATKGTGSFVESTTAVPSATTGGNLWPRMVSTGDTVYAISVTQSTAAATNPGALYHGLNGAVCFSRSKDAGATWDIVNTIPTGLDTSHYRGFGGDAYAIAANGNTVVVVAGGEGKDLILSKSINAGATWTFKIVHKFRYHKWDPSVTNTDTLGDGVAKYIETNDGNISVGLDNNNQAYVFYGNMNVKAATPLSTTGAYNYAPSTDGLMMWKESFATNGGVLVAQIQDLYQQGTIFFPPANPADTTQLPYGRWQCSLTSYPSVAFDASNTIYLSYSSIVDSLVSVIDPYKSVRHVYIIKSTDGGATWTTPCDLVGLPNNLAYEGMFASMAKRVNGFVHLIYQRDLAPGNGIPGTTASPNPDQTINESALSNNGPNDIIYLKIPVGDIGTCQQYLLGINELSSTVSNLNFYPNPASSNGTIEVSLAENAKMDIVVMNSVGQTVYTSSSEGTIGNNKVDINLSNLSAGLYFYQVKIANSKSVTKKFVVQK